MKTPLLLAAMLQMALKCVGADAQPTMPLQGEWRFALDRGDVGVTEEWFNRELADRIQLPGILQAQGYGDEISIDTPWVLSLYDRYWYQRADYQACTNAGHVKVPFLCQPRRHYVGVAWYQRDFTIPEDWRERRAELFLERTRWESTVWVDDQKVGSYNSLVAPHRYDLGVLAPGRHRLTIRLDSSMLMDYRPDAHAVSDSLGSTWNGIVGRMELRSRPPVWIENVQVFPDVNARSIRVAGVLRNRTGKRVEGKISCFVEPEAGTPPCATAPVSENFNTTVASNATMIDLKLGDQAKAWDEFSRPLYRLRVNVRGETEGRAFEFETSTRFGLSEFKTEGREFVINGRPTHLRGTHHGGDFPLTGYPPCDVDYWLELFRTCREWGVNHMRFHSFCPPEAAFSAADEIGIYLQPECGMWNTISPGTEVERMMYLETERMIEAYGNHPSFALFSPSNEPKGHWMESLSKWAEHFREMDPRRVYTTGTGHTEREVTNPTQGSDYLAVQRLGPRTLRRERGWFGRDYENSLEGVDIPVIAHEIGQWCAYPDYSVIEKFTGFIQPGNFEIFRDSLEAQGMLDRNKAFAWASGRFQLACYKEEIEANLRTRGLGGFQLLDLHDYTGQGTALVGLLDPFWEPKNYVTAGEWRQFCNVTVPLARLRQRVFTTADTFEVPVEVTHFGPAPLENVPSTWRIVGADGEVAARGEWPAKTIPLGKGTSLGTVSVDLSELPAPKAYQLIVTIGTDAVFKNSWKFWLYPAQMDVAVPPDVLVTRSWEDAESKLSEGGKVLFVPRKAELDWKSPPLDDVPVFWNRLMNPGWSRMLGLWCDTNHPALAGFPTDANCDWQWTSLIRGVRAMNLDHLPDGLQPIVQAIDDWNRNWKLGLVYECKVGAGKLIVCTIELDEDSDRRLVARQLRRSLLDYMSGPRFEPRVELSATVLRGALFDSLVMRHLGATVRAEGTNPDALIDGDPNTFWSAGVPSRGRRPQPHPHAFHINFPRAVPINGFIYVPRQNDRNHQGDIRDYTLEASDDGSRWREVSKGRLASSFNPQKLEFDETITVSHLRLTALSGFGDDPSSALAEFAVIYAGEKLVNRDTGQIEYQHVRSTSTDVDEGD